MKTVPIEFENIGTIMSNFDHKIVSDAEIKLQNGNCYGEYLAWDFFAQVWFENDKFYCMVEQYRSHVSTIVKDSLQEIMYECCKKYGSN